MSHTIRLTKNHRLILLQMLEESMIYKENHLKNPESIERMTKEYLNAAEKLSKGLVDCGRPGQRPGDNLFGWYRDQILHSGKICETEMGKIAISIAEACGNNRYEQYCQMTIINTLFE